MLVYMKEAFSFDPGVIVYTGYCFEELKEVPGADALLAQTDLLIDGPYIQELDDGRSLRGSSNQRIIPLTDRYANPEILALYGAEGRSAEYFWHGNSVNCVGVVNHLQNPDAPLAHFPVQPVAPSCSIAYTSTMFMAKKPERKKHESFSSFTPENELEPGCTHCCA